MTCLCKAVYYKTNQSYVVNVLGFTEYLNDIMFKFDTGAGCTVITLNALLPEGILKAEQMKLLGEQLHSLHYPHKKLISASGHEMLGTLCHVENAALSGQLFKNFYFYLVTDAKITKALLGADFISCCDFTHFSGKDIEITGFSESRYSAGFSLADKSKAFEIDSLTELIAGTQKMIPVL